MKQGAEPEAHKVHINTWRIVHVQDILIWWNLCTGSRVDQSNSAFTAPGQRIRRSLYPLWRKQRTVLDWTLWMINSKCWWGCYVKALLITLNNIQCDCSTIRCSLHIIKSCDTLIPPCLSKWCFMRNKQKKIHPFLDSHCLFHVVFEVDISIVNVSHISMQFLWCCSSCSKCCQEQQCGFMQDLRGSRAGGVLPYRQDCIKYKILDFGYG